MLIDLLNQDNYERYNVKLASVIGLEAAIYCNILVSIYDKAAKKKKTYEHDTVKVDRKYIMLRTTLTIEQQLAIDINLAKVDIIKKYNQDPDLLYLDISKLVAITTGDDVKALDRISDKVKVKNPKGIRQSQKERHIIQLKESINCSNEELSKALENWIEVVCNNPKTPYVSKTTLQIFKKGIDEYANHDLDLALKLVEIATLHSYTDPSWVISLYEQDLKNKRKPYVAKTTINNNNSIELSDTVF